ncbi:MAG: FAD-dependent oxidoreductase [Actinobacteria bacterium]|nr:FAD-dependent oxidoreductase [Actinomycetota bacterium]
MAESHVVVVGASLAGLQAAVTLRAEGFAEAVTVVGEEPHRPYDRPPLSKQVIAGDWDADRVALPAGAGASLDVTWELGTGAAGLDLAGRRVLLADGRALTFDGLVIATGAHPRPLPGVGALEGVHTLRTLEDALAVRAALDGGARRVVVVGAGFIGAEVAASCRQRGAEVTLVEPLPQPLARVLPEQVGAVLAEVHRSHGVDVRLGVGVEAIEGLGRVQGVRLADGTTVAADLVVVGIGVVPATGWLEGSGLTLDDGVVCDETTLAAPGVVAAGDVARWPNARYGEVMRVEHWEHAIDMGTHAARRLLADLAGEPGEPFAPVPWFWSDQYDRKVQLAGRPRPTDRFEVVAGSLAEARFCGLFGRDGQVVAALGMNMPGRVVRYRRELQDGLSWDDALAGAAPAVPPTS